MNILWYLSPRLSYRQTLTPACASLQVAAVTYYNHNRGAHAEGLLTVAHFSASLFVGFSPLVVALGHGKLRRRISGILQSCGHWLKQKHDKPAEIPEKDGKTTQSAKKWCGTLSVSTFSIVYQVPRYSWRVRWLHGCVCIFISYVLDHWVRECERQHVCVCVHDTAYLVAHSNAC